MAGQTSDDEDLAYGERWDDERLTYERERFEKHDRLFTRVPPRKARQRVREATIDERYIDRRTPPRTWEDHIREMRSYDESPHRRKSPPEVERRVYLERRQDREYRDSSPVPRSSGHLRSRSSLESLDRQSVERIYDREDHASAARRREYRLGAYELIPLPRSRALPPPRIYAENEYEDIRIAEPSRRGDDDPWAYPEHFREKELVRLVKHRDASESRTSHGRKYRSRSHRSSSRSSPTSSTSSDPGGTAITVKNEYPKKGKTKIPVRLVSIRAIADLEYPYLVEGNTVIIQKALGQKNIDDLLKLSDDYKKADAELTAARSVSEDHRDEVFTISSSSSPTLVRAPTAPSVEVVKEAAVGEIVPIQSYAMHNTTAGPSASCSCLASRAPVVFGAGARETSDNLLAGAVALLGDRRTDIHHQHRSHSRGREVVRAERLPTGEIVMYEEEIERIEEPRRGVRIEKNKKGRMSISVPKHRR